MPLEFDKHRRLFRVKLVGRIDQASVLKLLAEMLAHAEFRPGIPAVWDASNADLSALKVEDFQALRAYQVQQAATRGRARIAMVAANDLSFGVGRMFEQFTDLPHLDINVFRDLAAAEEWALAGAKSD